MGSPSGMELAALFYLSPLDAALILSLITVLISPFPSICPVSLLGTSHYIHRTASLRDPGPLWSAGSQAFSVIPRPHQWYSITSIPLVSGCIQHGPCVEWTTGSQSISTPSHFWEEVGRLLWQPESSLSILHGLEEDDGKREA